MIWIALVLPCHSRLDVDYFFWEITNTCLVLIVKNKNTRIAIFQLKVCCTYLSSYFYLLPYVYLHSMQRICFCALIVFVFASYLNGSAGESWNMRLGSLRLSSQRNPRLSFVTKVRDGKKHWRRLFSFSLAVLSSVRAVHTLLMSTLAIHFLMIRIRTQTKIITTCSQSMTMKA